MKNQKKNVTSLLEQDPLWYKDAIIYEIHVRAFCDSNADGIGDLRGLVEKMDYLQDLGVTALWLLPFYPSPLRDDGYDIADYTDVNPIYGTLHDFKLVLREAHRRGMRVITELVINHTSDQHPWFQRARRAAAGTNWRDFYVWSDTIEKYQEARIMFGDVESSNWTWDPIVKAFYWHRFYSHQPDLNFDNPAVHQAVFDVLDFWLNLGVDGMRLDAIPFLYEREGTTCESLPETHGFLQKLRRHVDERYPDRMLLAEANHWPEEMVQYFGQGDECHMAFHFPLMPRLFMAIHMEERFPIVDVLQQTPAIPDSSQWALFLRNHDELTLAMITAEDRDYMYRMYAQDPHARLNLGIRRRLAPLLENHRGKIELINGLLFSLPGTPVLYYGDEIGMGDNIYLGDRNGVRTPMQWTPERNAGFSHANPQRLYLPAIIDPEYHYQTVNVEAQQNNPHSLLWWTKRLTALRKRHQAFGRGTLEFLFPDNHKVLVFLRRYQDQQILVVANLSRFVQAAEVDLSALKGMVPVEMLGRTKLPAIGERPYLLTLGPYAFYWLLLGPAQMRLAPASADGQVPVLELVGAWQDVFSNRANDDLEPILLAYLSRQHWFVGKGGQPKAARIVENAPIPAAVSAGCLVLVEVEYMEGEPKTFVLPMAYAALPTGDAAATKSPQGVICRLSLQDEPGRESQRGMLYEPLQDRDFMRALLGALLRQRRIRGSTGEFLARTVTPRPRLRGSSDSGLEPALVKGEQSNTAVAYGERYLLKILRCVEEGIHPEVEIARALGEKTSFSHAAPLIGTLEYHPGSGSSTTVATLLGYIANEGDAWHYTLDALRRSFEHILTMPARGADPVLPNRPFLDLVDEELPPMVSELVGPYLEIARLMGRRTAQMHAAFASIVDDPAFAPEPFTFNYQQSTYQTARTWVFRVSTYLRQHLAELPEAARSAGQMLLGREADLVQHLRTILSRRITSPRIRCHGDYGLGSLLYTGKDFVVIDFEGENLRPLGNRRHKRSALRDVASLLHSLYSAVRIALHDEHLRPEDKPVLEPWARCWHVWVCVAFVRAYLEASRSRSFLPDSRAEMQILLDFYLLGRGIFELRHDLLNRPDRAQIPIVALLHLMEAQDRRAAVKHPSASPVHEPTKHEPAVQPT